MKGPVLVCMGLSVALHGAVGWALRGGSGGGASVVVSPAAASGVQLRVVAPPTAAAAGAAVAAVPAPPPGTDAVPKAGVVNETPPPLDSVDTGYERDISPPAGAGPADRGSLSAVADELDLYVPRPLLTVPPRPQGGVMLEFPADGPGLGRFAGVLALYIDEQGLVRHVRPEDDALPPELLRAAREAFMNLRFDPGRLDELAVRSRIRVEVLFESRPLPVQPDRTTAAAGSP